MYVCFLFALQGPKGDPGTVVCTFGHNRDCLSTIPLDLLMKIRKPCEVLDRSFFKKNHVLFTKVRKQLCLLLMKEVTSSSKTSTVP